MRFIEAIKKWKHGNVPELTNLGLPFANGRIHLCLCSDEVAWKSGNVDKRLQSKH